MKKLSFYIGNTLIVIKIRKSGKGTAAIFSPGQKAIFYQIS